MLDLDAWVHAIDPPIFQITKEAVVHEEDTLPLPLSTAGAPAVVSAPQRSFFQTDCLGLRAVLFVNWALTRSNGAAFMTGVTSW